MKHRTAFPMKNPARRQRGMTLVELMVGMAVGLMLVAGLVALYANASQSNSELDKSVRQIENGRYAVDLLAEDLSMAGYFGEAYADPTADGSAVTPLSPCEGSAAVMAAMQADAALSPAVLPAGVRGFTPSEAAALTCLDNYKAGTPAVVVRRLDVRPIAPGAMAANTLYVQSSFNPAQTTATYVASTSSGDMVLTNLAGATNTVRRYLSRIYYVATCSDCGRDTIPTLKRAELQGNRVVVTPLAEGIEHLGFDYGFDTDNDGTPNTWIGLNGAAATAAATAASAAGWRNVVAARIHVVARATESTAGYADARTYSGGLEGTATYTITPAATAYKRREYSTTTRLNVVAGQRE